MCHCVWKVLWIWKWKWGKCEQNVLEGCLKYVNLSTCHLPPTEIVACPHNLPKLQPILHPKFALASFCEEVGTFSYACIVSLSYASSSCPNVSTKWLASVGSCLSTRKLASHHICFDKIRILGRSHHYTSHLIKESIEI